MPASIFAGSKVKTLKDTLTLNGKSDIISSTVDPTASAVDAPIGSLLINQTSGKLYRKLDPGSSVNWEEVGSGTGGINYILNPSAEVNTTGWATYADAAGTAPVDGSGGSPNVTWTRSTSSPLRGVADFNFAKDAANRQGQGVSVDFTIDEADKAKVLSVTFDYEVLSGTYADADLTVYLIADPTGTPVVIQPAGYTVQAATVGTTMRQIATFQTQATGLSYRVCFHVASTSASAYTLAIDNVVVGPQQTVQGAAVSDWVSFTPTGSWAANTTYTGRWKRVGDSVQVQASLSLTGAPTATRLTINLPSGLVIDNTKRSGGASATINNIFGTGKTFDGVSAVHNLTVAYESTTAVAVSYESTATAQLNNVTNTSPFTYNSGDVLDIEYTVPITGWSSNTVLSQDTDTRVVAARATMTSGGPFGTGSVLIFNSISDPTRGEFDTHASYNTSTGVYTVPVSGIYQIDLNLWSGAGGTYLVRMENSAGTIEYARFFQNNTGIAAANISVAGSITQQFKAGDTFRISQTFGTATWASDANNTRLSVRRLSGPATIAASETVACRYKDSSGANIPGSAGVFKYTTKDYDTHGFYSTSTGLATIPVSGKYSVTASLHSSFQTLGVQQGIILFLYKNGSNYSTLGVMIGNGNANLYLGYGADSVQCVAGDTLAVYALWGAGVAVPSNPDSIYNHIAITRVGN